MIAATIVRATDDDVRTFALRRWPDDDSRRLYMELAETAPGGAWVARDESTPIGIAFAHALEDEWFFSELYVEPSFRSGGIGWRLLQEVGREAVDVPRSGLLDAADTSTLAFFLRRGVSLHVPILRIAGGIPREDELARMAAGDYRFRIESLDPLAHRFALDSLDREVRGSARGADHVLFSRRATGTVFLLNDECVGYAYVWPDGRIGPLVSASGAYLVQFYAYAMVSLRRTYGASWCMSLVPGNNIRIMRAAMRIGLTLDAVKIFATDQPLMDLSRYVGFHALDF
jgi:GNAT superfamily N-acetyltransferase